MLTFSLVGQKVNTNFYINNKTPFPLVCSEYKGPNSADHKKTTVINPNKQELFLAIPRKDGNMEPIYDYSLLAKFYVRIILPSVSQDQACATSDNPMPSNVAHVIAGTQNNGVGLIWNVGSLGNAKIEKNLDDAFFRIQSLNEYGPDNGMINLEFANQATDYKQTRMMRFPAYSCERTGDGPKDFEMQAVEDKEFIVTVSTITYGNKDWSDIICTIEYK
jgi:hypothetical protein